MPGLVIYKNDRPFLRYEIKKVLTTIGRSSRNDLCLEDMSVSSLHAHLLQRENQYILTDLGSTNGTFVNHHRIEKAVLADGDEITLGNVSIRFIAEFPEEEVKLDKTISGLQSLGVVKKQLKSLHKKISSLKSGEEKELEERVSSLEEQISKIEKQIAAREKDHRNLKTLYEVGSILNQLTDPHQLLDKVVELAIKLLLADRGFILLYDEEGELVPQTGIGIDKENFKEKLDISMSTIRKVVATKTTVLIPSTAEMQEIEEAKSIVNFRIKSILCCPLVNKEEKLIGVIYLDSRSPKNLFSREDQDLINSFANYIAVAIENAFLQEREKKMATQIAQLEERNKYTQLLEKLEEEKANLKRQIEESRYEDIIGGSAVMQRVFKDVEKVAPFDVTVLIEGETGTGKELIARAIHRKSLRAQKDLIVINCGTLASNLLESELFGHEKGAFTDAYFTKKGKFELANGGTIFLDEIGELSLGLQVKLLRVLQEQQFERVGGTRAITVNVRVLAATNKNLEEEVKKGTFREDLFYRLSVMRIYLPPLRERKEDFPLLVNYFIEKFNKEFHREIKGLSPEDYPALLRYPWRGNIRELENRIKRAVLMAENPTINLVDLGLASYQTAEERLPFKKARERLELEYLERAVKKYGRNISLCAKELGLDRKTVRQMLTKYNL
jgi:Nif-specific regulatory protein